MSADRRSRLLMRSNALAAAGNKSLPENIRAGYQKAADHLGVSLDLEDALQQKQENGLSNPMEQESQRENPPLNLFQ